MTDSDSSFSDSSKSEYSDINVSTEGYVRTIELNRPPNNFFDYSLIGEIADAFTAADADSNCRAIVLAAAGKHFCAGANFGTGNDDNTGSDDFTEEGFRNTTGKLYREAARLFECRTPIVGAIHGAAIGGGLGLALVPDFRIACPEARFAANFTKLGIHQGFGISVTLPRIVGQQAAAMMLLTARRIGGEEAAEIGLVDILTSFEQVRDRAMELAREIAANAPLAVSSVKATLRQSLADQVRSATEHELKEQQWLRATEDAGEGIRAVAERRPGNFQGR